MKSYPQLFLVLVFASLAACSTITVTTDYALEQGFVGYHTYQWHPDGIKRNAALNTMGGDIFDARVRRVIDQTLAEKSMKEGPDPQFYVNYSVVTEDRVSINSYNTYGGYGPGWGYYGYGGYGAWGMGSTHTSVTHYTQGMLVIDIIDAATNKLVWRSTADSRLNQQQSPEKKEQELRQSVGKMFQNFPPQRPQQ